MKPKLVIGIFLSVLAWAFAEDKVCKEAITEVLKSQLGGVTQCLVKLGYEDPKERAAKMALGEDGYPDPIAALSFLEKSIPEHVKEKSTLIIMSCMDAAVNVDPKEENCKSYGGIVKCAMMAINKFCE